FDEVYVRDRCLGASGCTPSTQRLSYGIPGNPLPTGRSSDPAISANGRYVCFQTMGSNITRASGIVIRDLATGLAENVDLNFDGSPGYSGDFCDISGDGRFVSFRSAGIVKDALGFPYFSPYVHDRATGITELAARDSAGNPGVCTQLPFFGNVCSNPQLFLPPALSDDGTVVAFGSQFANLVPADTGMNADQNYQVFVRGPAPDPANVTASDLDGDGELDDAPLFVLDPTEPPSAVTLCPADAASVAGGRAAYLRRESSGGTGGWAARSRYRPTPTHPTAVA